MIIYSLHSQTLSNWCVLKCICFDNGHSLTLTRSNNDLCIIIYCYFSNAWGQSCVHLRITNVNNVNGVAIDGNNKATIQTVLQTMIQAVIHVIINQSKCNQYCMIQKAD